MTKIMHKNSFGKRYIKTGKCCIYNREDDIKLTIFPDRSHVVGGRLLKQRYNVLVQRVHVLEEPLVAVIVHLASVMDEAEAGLVSEVRFLELGVARVLRQ